MVLVDGPLKEIITIVLSEKGEHLRQGNKTLHHTSEEGAIEGSEGEKIRNKVRLVKGVKHVKVIHEDKEPIHDFYHLMTEISEVIEEVHQSLEDKAAVVLDSSTIGEMLIQGVEAVEVMMIEGVRAMVGGLEVEKTRIAVMIAVAVVEIVAEAVDDVVTKASKHACPHNVSQSLVN